MKSKTREEELCILVNHEKPDVVLISEAELGPHDTVVIPGYVSFLASLSSSGRRRLFALVKNKLSTNTVMLASSEMDIWLRLNLPISPLNIVGVYRQWSDSERADLASFYDRCSNLLDGTKTIISGDFNLDFSRMSDASYTRHLMASKHFSTMEALGLQYIGPYTPTYKSHGRYRSANGEYSNRTSIIDHVYMLGGAEAEVTVVPNGATDHMPVKTVISHISPFSRSGRRWISRRPLAQLSRPVLCRALDQTFEETSTDLYNCTDVDVVHDTIVEAIVKSLDKVAPYRMVPSDRPDRPPLFLAQDTLMAMRLRDVAAASSLPTYKVLRNKVCRLLRRDRLRSSLRGISQSRNNPRKLWSLARSFMGANNHSNLPSSLRLDDGSTCTDEKTLSQNLNSFFIDKITRIRNSITSSQCNTCETLCTYGGACTDMNSNKEYFNFKYPSAGKVEAIISTLKNTGAVGVDDIPIAVLKLGAPVLAGPIAHLIRVSFNSAKVPLAFKSAMVKPIYKGKSKPTTAASSYRPVAILTAMSKILERCVFETLTEFLEPRLPEGQYGFRKMRSTTAAIADAHGKWSSIRASGHILGVAGFDLTAAFDTLDSSLLCAKLSRLGICGRANDWFKNYLCDRKQCVVLGDTKSKFLSVGHGVPQGSLLGPVLFLAMVADMPEEVGLVQSPSRGYVTYADDICVWAYGATIEAVKE